MDRAWAVGRSLAGDPRMTWAQPGVLLALACLALLPTSLTAQSISVTYNHKIDFSKYKAFAWSEAQEPPSSLPNGTLIAEAVDHALEAKGLSKSATADTGLRIRYIGKVANKVYGQSYETESPWDPTNLRTMVDIKKVKEGTLVLEFKDAKTDAVVWRAMVSEVLGRPEGVEEQIKDAVQRLLQDFPPRNP